MIAGATSPQGVTVRTATRDDVPAIVALLTDDPLGATRETGADDTAYLTAFEAIDSDPAHDLVVLDDGGEIVGTLQLTILPGLSRGGALRAQIEAVRVASSRRGAGLGEFLFRWAIDESRRRGAVIVQLTTDLSREGAHRFYERLGFVATHAGMKLPL
ncbi:GNAT family N-acetyltransferase [Knoellia subterranea]|uniref:GNAT family acetyltransferase n=1 Tax=Knoellia subterranea KCTC 19937 TaxID=1385521 RepID=A0A0A0JI33_9MICO|nr:GNAT family N-acetyltransferase [Knoellia subterranea]KGN36414.1 GNAT family acetyltransferase [Knoellia subterranea KCTC 19937]